MTNNSISKPPAILFVGNGYDRALGYNTSYRDFYNSNFFKTLLDQKNGICIQIDKEMQEKKTLELWSDLETGLYEYSIQITRKYEVGNEEVARKFKGEFDELKKALFGYLNKEQKAKQPIGSSWQIDRLQKEWKKLNCQLITFNYTGILPIEWMEPNLYNPDKTYDNRHITYQHESMYNPGQSHDNPYDRIVLGIDDVCQEVEQLHNFLYKSNQSRFSIDRLKEFLDEKDVFIVFGCSMGLSDAVYYKMLFDKKYRGTKYYLIYGRDAKSIRDIKDNMLNYVDNMVVFGRQENVKFITCGGTGCVDETSDIIDRYLENHKPLTK